MELFDIVFLSVALAMDCFAVSIVGGVVMQRRVWRVMLQTAFLFGLFQAFMPLLGWLATSSFERYIQAFDHWIAFALLSFLGVRMIRDSFKTNDEEVGFHLEQLSTQLLQAVATSIDALAVGISFAAMGYRATTLIVPLAVIGAGSFLFSVLGYELGISFGQSIRKTLKPELLGGVILLFIGFKVLITHLFF